MSQIPKKDSIWHHYKHDPKKQVNHMAYQIVGTAFDTRSDKLVIVYKPLYDISKSDHGDIDFYTRPLEEWYEIIEYNGQFYQRFREVSLEEKNKITTLKSIKITTT